MYAKLDSVHCMPGVSPSPVIIQSLLQGQKPSKSASLKPQVQLSRGTAILVVMLAVKEHGTFKDSIQTPLFHHCMTYRELPLLPERPKASQSLRLIGEAGHSLVSHLGP